MTSFVSYGTVGSFGTIYDQDEVEEDNTVKVIPRLDSKFFEQQRLNQKAETAGRCKCTFPISKQYLQGWEIYKPQSLYINSNTSTKPSSTATLRRLVTDRTLKRIINGRPTVLGRLINGMRKAPPEPPYEYGNCLQYSLELEEFKIRDNFLLKNVVNRVSEKNDSKCYSPKSGKEKRRRRTNPFREVQLCPKSMYSIILQPPKQENVKRSDNLLDLRKY